MLPLVGLLFATSLIAPSTPVYADPVPETGIPAAGELSILRRCAGVGHRDGSSTNYEDYAGVADH